MARRGPGRGSLEVYPRFKHSFPGDLVVSKSPSPVGLGALSSVQDKSWKTELVHSCIQHVFIKHHLCARPGTIATNKTSVVSIVTTPFRGRRPRQKAANKCTTSDSSGSSEESRLGKGRGAGLEDLPEGLHWRSSA